MMNRFVLAALCYVAMTVPASGETSVWKVETGGSVTYLGGTCHVLRKSDYPLPVEFETAYRDSAVIAFEADLEKMNAPETLQALLRQGLYPEGVTLQTSLSPKAYGALKAYCADAGIPVSMVHRMKPWLAVMTLLSLELKNLGVSESGVDEHFHNRAVSDGKRVAALESVQKQVEVIGLMGKGYEEDFVVYSIRDLKRSREIVNEIIGMWRSGDEKSMEELFSEQMKEECPDLYELVLVHRNLKWLDGIEGYLRTPEKEFLLVGVAHLVGKDGIIALLRQRGYQVEKVRLHGSGSYQGGR